MRLQGPINDLEIARKAVSEMASATEFSKFSQAWQDFLFRLERAWENAERTLRSEQGFQQWFRPYTQQRKKDPLLVFLNQARHAETHAISPTIDKPFRLVVQDRFGHPFRISSVKSSFEDGVLTIDIESAPEDSLLDYVAFPLPSNPKLVRFRNRGKWYEPPKTHLGKPLLSVHPVDVAKLGLAFYSAFINEASFRFK